MPVTDPIADMLTRIRNAVSARHDTVLMPASNMKEALCLILKREGFVKDFEVVKEEPQNKIRIHLRYMDADREKESAIRGLKRVSKPGLRVHVQKGEIPRVYGGTGISILSTSQGVLTGQEAWQRGVGGELLCYVW